MPAIVGSRHTANDNAHAWAGEVGQLWAQLFTQQHLPREWRVVEIGPGFSAKIGIGLAEIGFRGELILVEPNPLASRWAEREYRRLLPAAEIRVDRTAVPELDRSPAGPVDLLVGNHILDDLLLNAQVSTARAERLFAGMRPGSDCAEQFVHAWLHINACPARVDRLVNHVSGNVLAYLGRIRPAGVILSEYPSWRHGRRGLDFIHGIGLRTLREIEQRLKSGRYITTHIRQADAPISWLISPMLASRREDRP